jgi:hypothetical protein
MDLPAPKVEKKENVAGHQAAQRPYLGGKEGGRDEDLHMRADKFFPGGDLLPLWGGWDAIALEDVAHGLITDRVSQMLQYTGNAVIAPTAVLLGQAHYYGLQLRIDRWTPSSLPLLGAIELLCHELPVPGENGVGHDDGGHLWQCLLAKFSPNLGKGLPLGIAAPDAALNLPAQLAILRHQVFIAEQEFLVDYSRDIGQQLLPIHGTSSSLFLVLPL